MHMSELIDDEALGQEVSRVGLLGKEITQGTDCSGDDRVLLMRPLPVDEERQSHGVVKPGESTAMCSSPVSRHCLWAPHDGLGLEIDGEG